MIYANWIEVIDYGEQKSIHSSEKADKAPDSCTVVEALLQESPPDLLNRQELNLKTRNNLVQWGGFWKSAGHSPLFIDMWTNWTTRRDMMPINPVIQSHDTETFHCDTLITSIKYFWLPGAFHSLSWERREKFLYCAAQGQDLSWEKLGETLTCLFVFLLVWPDDGAETGEDQRAKSARSFLWSAVIIEGILAQNEPVAPLLDPVSSHLQ